MEKHTYKNISGVKQDVTGIGSVEAGGTITTSAIINNSNFELVEEPKKEEKSVTKKK